MATTKVTPAAGGVLWRPAPETRDGIEILLVHRPSYDDWTYPKGKAERGELPPVTAAREIAEETGVTPRLGRPLPTVSYRVRGGVKDVRYWFARPRGRASSFTPGREVDEIAWVDLRAARRRLSYEHDIALLDQVEDLVAQDAHRSRTLVLLRHASALPRSSFAGDDLDRPLSDQGRREAQALTPTLAAYGIRRVVSSPALRCVQTVEPYAAAHRRELRRDAALREGVDPADAAAVVHAALDRKSVLLCSHRPTFPALFEALGLADAGLAPGEAAVIHHRRGHLLDTERW